MLLHEYFDAIQSIIKGYSRANLILASEINIDFRTDKIGIIQGPSILSTNHPSILPNISTFVTASIN